MGLEVSPRVQLESYLTPGRVQGEASAHQFEPDNVGVFGPTGSSVELVELKATVEVYDNGPVERDEDPRLAHPPAG